MALAEVQQLAQALVLLNGLLGVAHLLERLGKLVAQGVVVRLQLVIPIDRAVESLQPAGRRGRSLLERLAELAVQIREETRFSAEEAVEQRYHQHRRQDHRQKADACLFEK